VGQSNDRSIPASNDLIEEVATEIALSQAATASFDAAAAEVLGLNQTDLRCLGRLHNAGPMTAGALARACGLSPGAMTTAVDRLERAGYVRRVRSETDRRRVSVEVTSQALELMEAIWGPIAFEGKAQLAEFNGDQLAFLVGFLRHGRELQEREAARVRQMTGPSNGRVQKLVS
jgi:DNA-binding MarR family transcriptional regulator